jgi:hypothetical protein
LPLDLRRRSLARREKTLFSQNRIQASCDLIL